MLTVDCPIHTHARTHACTHARTHARTHAVIGHEHMSMHSPMLYRGPFGHILPAATQTHAIPEDIRSDSEYNSDLTMK